MLKKLLNSKIRKYYQQKPSWLSDQICLSLTNHSLEKYACCFESKADELIWYAQFLNIIQQEMSFASTNEDEYDISTLNNDFDIISKRFRELRELVNQVCAHLIKYGYESEYALAQNIKKTEIRLAREIEIRFLNLNQRLDKAGFSQFKCNPRV